MIEKRKLMVARKRREPQRQLGEIGRERVLVDAIEAALRDETLGKDFSAVLLLVQRNIPRLLIGMTLPCLDQPGRERAARLDQEGTGTHGGITHLEIEYLFRRRIRPQPLEGRLQRMTHDRLGEAARRVVAAGAAALVGRLQDRRARRRLVLARGGALIDDGVERWGEIGNRLCGFDSFADGRGELAAVGLLLEILDALLALLRQQLFEIDEYRRAVVLAGADRERAALRRLDLETHHDLIDRADLLHIERAIGKPFAAVRPLEGHHPFKDAQYATIGHRQHARRTAGVVAAFEEREGIRIEQLAAAGLDEMRPMPLMNEAEQRQEVAPRAAALVHGVWVERCVFAQPTEEAAYRIAAFI